MEAPGELAAGGGQSEPRLRSMTSRRKPKLNPLHRRPAGAHRAGTGKEFGAAGPLADDLRPTPTGCRIVRPAAHRFASPERVEQGKRARSRAELRAFKSLSNLCQLSRVRPSSARRDETRPFVRPLSRWQISKLHECSRARSTTDGCRQGARVALAHLGPTGHQPRASQTASRPRTMSARPNLRTSAS